MSLLFTKKIPQNKNICNEHTQLLPKNLSSDYQECPECFRKLEREPVWYQKEETYFLSSLSWSWNGSVQFRRSVVSDSLWPHEPQMPGLPVLSPAPGVYPNSCPLSHWCHPTISSSVVPFSFCLQSSPTSNESALRIRWPKHWSFSFNISPSNEHTGLISFRMDWLDLLAVLVTVNSLLQHHSSKPSVLWCSAFFTVQLSHPYMTTGKNHSLD